MNPRFCAPRVSEDTRLDGGGTDGNVVKTVVGFWLRRTIDGTADEFHANLARQLEPYDSAWLSANSRPG
jgi:hypothetical protein